MLLPCVPADPAEHNLAGTTLVCSSAGSPAVRRFSRRFAVPEESGRAEPVPAQAPGRGVGGGPRDCRGLRSGQVGTEGGRSTDSDQRSLDRISVHRDRGRTRILRPSLPLGAGPAILGAAARDGVITSTPERPYQDRTSSKSCRKSKSASARRLDSLRARSSSTAAESRSRGRRRMAWSKAWPSISP